MRQSLIFGLASIAIFLFSACGKDAASPEEKIYQMMEQMESAIQERSLDRVKTMVSSGYTDEWHPSRAAALRSLIFYFQGHQNIHLLTRVTDLQISHDEKSANLVIYVGMAGKPIENADYLIALKADLFRFDVNLVNDGGDWLVAGASWQRVRPESFGL